jgi:DNA polymerase-1
MKVLIADTETDGFLENVTQMWVLVVKELGKKPERYSSKAGNIDKGLARLKDADRIVFHNGLNYDVPVLWKLYGKDAVDHRKVFDTMVAARLFDPEAKDGHSLDAWGGRMGFPKGSHNDFSKWSQEMEDYCVRDVEVCERLYLYLIKQLAGQEQAVQLEHDFAWIISLQMRNGFQFDVSRAQGLVSDLSQEKADAEKKLIEAFGPTWKNEGEFVPKKSAKNGYIEGVPLTKVKLVPFNPGSRDMIAGKLIRKYGWKPKHYTDAGNIQVDESVLKELKYPEIPLILNYLRLDKMLGQLDGPVKKNGSGGGWLKHVKNGRIYGYVNSNGAVTGRCTHSKPNVANADKDKRMRMLWIPRVGWVLVGCDAEGLELRMLAHYLAAHDGGAYARAVVEGKKEDKTDNHSITQRTVGLNYRDSAKTFIYALIYGAGDAKLGLIIIEDALKAGKPKPSGSPSAIGAAARAKLVKGLTGYGKLTQGVGFKVKKTQKLKGLDGRTLNVRSAHSALNTLLQSAGAIVMKKAAILFHAIHEETHGKTWAYCANVHDEVQIEAASDELARVLGASFAACIKQAGIDLGVRCPLAGSFDVGANWSETH